MKTLSNKTTILYEIEKSKFYGIAFHVENIDDFKQCLNDIKKEYPKANHYCYAYSINNQNKNNDDGEPGGTAGLPIMENIIKRELNNVAVIVIRYFGGVKLGAGGLTRAYNKTASDVLNASKIINIIKTKTYKLKYDYSLHNVINTCLKKMDTVDVSIEYNEFIERIIATNDNIDSLFDLCLGKINIIQDKEIDVIKDS